MATKKKLLKTAKDIRKLWKQQALSGSITDFVPRKHRKYTDKCSIPGGMITNWDGEHLIKLYKDACPPNMGLVWEQNPCNSKEKHSNQFLKNMARKYTKCAHLRNKFTDTCIVHPDDGHMYAQKHMENYAKECNAKQTPKNTTGGSKRTSKRAKRPPKKTTKKAKKTKAKKAKLCGGKRLDGKPCKRRVFKYTKCYHHRRRRK